MGRGCAGAPLWGGVQCMGWVGAGEHAPEGRPCHGSTCAGVQGEIDLTPNRKSPATVKGRGSRWGALSLPLLRRLGGSGIIRAVGGIGRGARAMPRHRGAHLRGWGAKVASASRDGVQG